jgi:hypothetical protein
MVKKTFTLLVLLAFAGFSYSQMVEDFEHIPFNLMLAEEEDDSQIVVVQDEERGYVGEFTRSQHGVPWGGFWSSLPEPIDMTEKKYIHVDVWKPRISPLRFKVEGGPGGDFELEPVEEQTLTEEWETITFYFPDADGEYPIIAFMPDFEEPVDLDEDIMIYFDNIVLSDNATPGEGDEEVIENFDFIPMNLMAGGAEDDSEFRIVPNPLPDEVNESSHVVEFRRSQHGVSWGGFWSPLPEPLDLSENKYVYVKVWKPRISPLRFKVEGGPTADLEIESMFPQTEVEQWEEIVFDFSEKDGQWNIIAFMPDFADPVDLDEDIVIYFDQIRLGEAPTDVSVIRLPDDSFDLKVYPNPASDNVTVEAPVNSRIDLIDIAGNIIFRQTAVNPVTTIDLGDVAAGLYLVRVVDGNSVRTIKLVVQ